MKFFKDSSGLRFWIEKIGDKFWIHSKGKTFLFSEKDLFQTKALSPDEVVKTKSSEGEQERSLILKAPLPGKVLYIKVKKGERVKKNSSLIVIEAMKMEHTLSADFETRVEDIFVKEGDFVDFNQKLLCFSQN